MKPVPARVLPVAVAGLLAAAIGVCLAQGIGAPPRAPTDPWRPRHDWGSEVTSPSARARMQRHFTYMSTGVPREYRGRKSPLRQTPQAIDRGRKLYRSHCARCHAMDGKGGGEAALGLAPSPALLGFLIERPGAADEYLLWTISEGGKPFGTAMPAFKDALARDDIWAIIAFMRAGFPPSGTAPSRPAPAGR